MENSNEMSEFLREVIDSLASENLSRIDFDRLSAWLSDHDRHEAGSCDIRQELKLLRDDYRQRIAGMVKAIAVVQRKPDAIDSAVELIESLDTLKAADLVDCYRRVSARFRDAFPTSFGNLTKHSRTQTTIGDIRACK